MSGSRRAPCVVTCFLVVAATDVLPRLAGLRRTLKVARRLAASGATEGDVVLADEIAQRVALAAAFYPRRALCLEQSLALFLLLRWRGVPSELRLGVQARPFSAHAWVDVGGRAVNERGDLPLRLALFPGFGG
jgi:hypothetical protein